MENGGGETGRCRGKREFDMAKSHVCVCVCARTRFFFTAGSRDDTKANSESPRSPTSSKAQKIIGIAQHRTAHSTPTHSTRHTATASLSSFFRHTCINLLRVVAHTLQVMFSIAHHEFPLFQLKSTLLSPQTAKSGNRPDSNIPLP